MIALLALVLALQTDPRIEQVERLLGDVGRPLHWAPLKVTLSSAAGFKGELVARSAFGFSVARDVALAPGGKLEVLMPALDPLELRVGGTSRKLPRPGLRPDFVVVVDARLPFADDLVSDAKTLYTKMDGADLEKLRARGLLEGADRVLTAGATKEAALAPILARPATLEAVDRELWTLAPSSGWVPAKRSMALYFAAVYAFAAFVGLAGLTRRFPKFGVAAVALVALAGSGGYLLLFPRGQVWIVEQRLEVHPTDGSPLEHQYWFVQSAADRTTGVAFPRLVKPIFASAAGADEPFTIRVDEQGSRVEGLRLPSGGSACFGSAGVPSKGEGAGRPLYQGAIDEGGVLRAFEALPPGPGSTAEPARSAEIQAFRRFLSGKGVIGRLWTGDRPAADVASPDLADARERPLLVIRRQP